MDQFFGKSTHRAYDETTLLYQPTSTTTSSWIEDLLHDINAPRFKRSAMVLEIDYDKNPPILMLTLRELECLQMIAKGLSNQEVASVLSVSTATIRTHLEHIYQKLDVSNRVEAITEGIRQGLIEL